MTISDQKGDGPKEPPSARAMRAATKIAEDAYRVSTHFGLPLDKPITRWACMIDRAMAEPAAPPGDGDAALLGLTSIVKHLDQRVTALEAQLEDAAPPQGERLLVDEVEVLCGNCPGNSVVCEMNPSIVAANEVLYICPTCLAQVNVSRAGWTPLPPAPAKETN